MSWVRTSLGAADIEHSRVVEKPRAAGPAARLRRAAIKADSPVILSLHALVRPERSRGALALDRKLRPSSSLGTNGIYGFLLGL
jgi:hypothetical protein